MKTRVSIIIMSHLSDVQENQRLMHQQDNNKRINFVKYLVTKHKDTSVEVDADEEYKEFETKFPHLV